jgi:hypothetical protein
MASAMIQSRFPAGDKKIAALMNAAGEVCSITPASFSRPSKRINGGMADRYLRHATLPQEHN